MILKLVVGTVSAFVILWFMMVMGDADPRMAAGAALLLIVLGYAVFGLGWAILS